MTLSATAFDGNESPLPVTRQRRRLTVKGRRTLIALAVVVIGVGGYLAGGFLRFTEEVSEFAVPPQVERADGIVVLTGGALRIDHAIDLLKDGRGRRLLISGVNPGTSVETLARMTETDKSWFECCVDIDYAALNTVGNAEIANRWAKRRGFHDLILVTSDYHMPRSLFEFDRMGAIRSVTPYAVRRDDFWQLETIPSRAGLKILLTEYAKLLATRARAALGLLPQEAAEEGVLQIGPMARR
ncbi:YdcF family protein [Aurantimonas sp. VKM B-3413]|uniref:YdcF family protein n=1 Tax=Aurantimonas sp. VKM B-3413 TaxID=2779401 RepID=UPI001E603546|nr:YdcF family protein [Aurantimonas sp. VKM B-3413]MCB8837237.1 YdcF family protein [Aurantimonas sp. VKM B-3413]